MFKKLDRLLIRSFVGPFVLTFFVMLFVLTMQFFWLYMDELIGKGFGAMLILKLLAYMSTTMAPLALPLAVLVASIMTFGNLGENYELIAIKSSGVSLIRILQPLFIFMLFICGVAFFISNNIIPVASLKAYTLLYDLRNSKLTLSMREGQFNKEINGFSIRIGKKSKDGNKIYDVLIYDNSGGYGNDKIIMAKEGQMIPSASRRYLTFRLKDGCRYEETVSTKDNQTNHSQTRMYFKEMDKIFDLSSFQIKKTDENAMRGGQSMMNISQLNANIDSTEKTIPRTKNQFSYELGNYISLLSLDSVQIKSLLYNEKLKVRKYATYAYQMFDDSTKINTIEAAESQIRSIKLFTEVSTKSLEIYNNQITNFNIEWHRKFVLSAACLLMFLIGAPLGAIIRKGGIGTPLVIATIFFVLYFIISKSGESLASTNDVSPVIGMWLSTLVLLPFAIIFINAALKDAKMFSKEWYLQLIQLVKKIFNVKTKNMH